MLILHLGKENSFFQFYGVIITVEHVIKSNKLITSEGYDQHEKSRKGSSFPKCTKLKKIAMRTFKIVDMFTLFFFSFKPRLCHNSVRNLTYVDVFK